MKVGPFSKREDSRLRDLRSKGLTAPQIAKKMSRTSYSVEHRIRILKLPLLGAITPELRDQIKSLYAKGYTMQKVASEVGRTYSSVKHLIEKMKLKSVKLYTKKELKKIKEMFSNGSSLEEIAKEIDRPLPGLKRKMSIMKIFSSREYSRKELAIIRKSIRQGLNAVQIAKLLPQRNLTSVRRKVSSMKKKPKKLKKQLEARKARRMTREQHSVFCTFLHKATKNRLEPIPILEIMMLWNKKAKAENLPEATRDKIEYWLIKLKLPYITGKNVKAVSPEAHRLRQLRKRKTRKQSLSKADEEEEIRLCELEVRARINKDVTWSFCPFCSKDHPVTKDFFYFFRDSKTGDTVARLNSCKQCLRKRRRTTSEMKAKGISAQDIRDFLKSSSRQARKNKIANSN